MPGGWRGNIAGSDAVELTLKNGKLCRIGTDVPDELERAITAALPADDRQEI